MFCSNCQFSVQRTDNFCGKCGTPIRGEQPISESNVQNFSSMYEGEKLLKVFRRHNAVKIFNDDTHIAFLQESPIDIFFTNKRICLTSSNEDAKKPNKISLLLPLGGAIGFGLNSIAVDAVNFARDKLFENKVGGTPTAIQFDSMCGEDSCIFSYGNVTAIMNKKKTRSLFEFAIGEEKTTEIAFMSKFQTSKGLISGGFIVSCVGDKSDMEYTFGKIENISFTETEKSLDLSSFYLYCKKYIDK